MDFKFNRGDIVLHRNGDIYRVVSQPIDEDDGLEIRLESTGKLAYAYRAPLGKVVWMRDMVEFEDGRFTKVGEAN